MNKSNNFVGQHRFSQITSLCSEKNISSKKSPINRVESEVNISDHIANHSKVAKQTWAYEVGFGYYKAFSDSLNKISLESDYSYSMANRMKNDLAVANYNTRQKELDIRNIKPQSMEYDQRTKEYNKGYYVARKMADSLIESRLNKFILSP